MPLYELDEGGMRKFYRIEREGTRVVLQWGRIGSAGRRKVLTFADEEAAKAAFEHEKLRRHGRGYLRVADEAAPHDATVARAAAATSRLAAAAPLTRAPRFLFVDRKRRRFVWLEQRGSELWTASGEVGDEAKAQPTAQSFASPKAAERYQSQRVAELLAKGYVLDAFDARPPKRKPKAAPPSLWADDPSTTAADRRAARERTAPADPARPWAGQRWMFFGAFAVWPRYHGRSPAEVAELRGARVIDAVADDMDSGIDVVVFGDLRGPGRAEAKKRAARFPGLEILDEAAYRARVRIDLAGKRFAFVGGFDCSPAGLAELDGSLLARMVEAAGGIVTTEIDATLDYLAVGNRRGEGKIAAINRVTRLVAGGARITQLDEDAFLDLVRLDIAGGRPASAALDFAGFLAQLYGHVDRGKLGRALDMLRKERFWLYARLDTARLVGVVRSQSGSGSVYASWLTHDGRYGCTQPDLSDCMGLQGSTCKHLMALVVGLARTGQLALPQALAWMQATGGKAPRTDTELAAETFLQYKGAEAGEVDWRPTETIPEDFYAV